MSVEISKPAVTIKAWMSELEAIVATDMIT